MKNNQAYGIGEYSTSPAGQGCIWVAALGVIGVLAFSYLSTYAGVTHDPLDRMESGIEGVTRTPESSRSETTSSRRRYRRLRNVEQYAE
jgi:hypothetical protein